MTVSGTKSQSVGLRGASVLGSSKISSVSSVTITGERTRTIAINAASGKISASESRNHREPRARAKGGK